MYLKSLVLKGFKSFADRSVMTFEPGITAVVGPNGSGKSNVSDAVLWVLGERNAKNLRGAAMEDVIFAGSSARKPVGVAEVDLVLDNADGTLPIDFTEVAITRRMYRSGESEYLINGTPARRMDVLDILHDSGLGTGTHSIISQGHLSGILQSKPEDRRSLIEEAAGVLKHKQRKAKAERKLARMDDHLARVNDVMAEVERQVKPLERKAKRALAYNDISAKLAAARLQLAVDDLRTLQRTWEGTQKREEGAGEELSGLRARIEEAEAEAERLQAQLAAQSAADARQAAQYRRASGAADKLDGNTLLLHERKRSIASYLTERRIQLQTEARTQTAAAEALQAAAEALEAAVAERERADAALVVARERTAEVQARSRELQAQVDAAAAKRRDALAELEAVRERAARTQEVLASNRAQEQLIDAHAAELQERLDAALRARDEAQAADREQAEQLEEAKAADAQARVTQGAAAAALDEVRSTLDAARDVQAASGATVRALEQALVARNAGNDVLQRALDAAPEGASALLEYLDVDPSVASLVEQLLGDDLQALVMEGGEEALQLLQQASGGDASGAVAVLPARSMRGSAVLAPEGTRRLVDLVSYPAHAAGAVEALLGHVVVCDTPEAAQRTALDFPGIVGATAQGLVAWPSGKLSFARSSRDAESAIDLHRQLEAARVEHGQAKAAFEQAQLEAEACEQAMRDAQQAQLSASQRLASLQGSAKAARAEAERAEAAHVAVQREAERIGKQRDAARAALAEAEPQAAQLAERDKLLSEAIDDAKGELDAAREALSPVRAAADDAANALAEAKLSAATAKERTDYAVRMKLARERDVEAAAQAISRTREAIAAKELAAVRIDPLLEIFESLSTAARARTQALEDATSRSQGESSALHERINAARAAAREAHDRFDAANERLGDARVERGRLEMQVEAAIKQITQECRTPLDVAVELPELEDRPALEAEAARLQKRIEGLGAINPEAAAEYEQLKTRYDYLREQVDDMESARRSLAKIVRVIDARMRDDFAETFDQVNENFKEIFGTLFPGGSGSLTLVDPADMENTGVEVNAQPHGKRILKMSLMSGGEQSLTALALLFAVYRTRSTPFYILDEVEAALDDTNLRRLTAYLDGIRDHTQFIMITHQRRTMEMADVLYGISMQSDGVTKVMSQRLDKALRYAE